jgi:hypothetical protein
MKPVHPMTVGLSEPLSTTAPGAPPQFAAMEDLSSSRESRWMVWVLGGVAALLFALAAVWPAPAFDLFWQLKTGELIAASRSVPHADPFSHTAAGDPWIVQEWLTELLMFLLFSRVSPDALVLAKMALVSLAFSLLLARCFVRTRQPLVAVAFAVLGAYAARHFFDLRPQVVTFACLAWVLLALEQWRTGRWRRGIWSIPVVVGVWSNCHSGFMVGLVVVGIELVGSVLEGWSKGERRKEEWQTLGGVLGASVVAGLLNPNGIQTYVYPFILLTHHAMLDSIGEWLSPNFHLKWLRPYEALLIGSILCWGVSTRPRRVADVIMVLGCIQASLYSTRHVPIFVLVCTPIVAEHIGNGLQRVQAWFEQRLSVGLPMRLAAGLAVLLGMVGLIAMEWQRVPARSWFAYCTKLNEMPQSAVDYIRQHPGVGNLLNAYDWGGYCLWRLYPDQKVFIDGRAEVYFEKAFEDYAHIVGLKAGWGDLLAEWHIDTILVPTDCGIARALPFVGGWDVAFQDKTAVVLRRKPQ